MFYLILYSQDYKVMCSYKKNNNNWAMQLKKKMEKIALAFSI